jgi:hypothetical protein
VRPLSCLWPGFFPVAMAVAAAFFAFDARACADFRGAPSSRWSIAATANGPLLLTPCGTPFFSLGVNIIDGGTEVRVDSPRAYRWSRFAETRAGWAAAAGRRLLDWGFNTAGSWSVPPGEIGLPSTPEVELGHWQRVIWLDPFDPALPARLASAAAQVVAPYRGNPLRIGYFSDNEIGWWNGPLFMAYMAYPPENHTKRRLIDLVRAHYHDDWQAFAHDFVAAPGATSFADLLASRTAPHLRPDGGGGIAIVRAWTAIVAAQYYKLMRDALHRADPDALYLGDRLPIYYDPDAVRAMAPYVDAISVNYNVDAADGWIAPYFFDGLRDLSGGKPVLITEWFYAANENRSGNLNRTGEPHTKADWRTSNNRNRTGHLMTVPTQAERARGAARAVLRLEAVPNAIGVHWFQYADEPPGGRVDGEDYDFGLVDVDDHPYERLVDALRGSNREILQRLRQTLPDGKSPDAKTSPQLALPRAAIDPAEESLADWPKSASLLAMKAAPGEVNFGDVHLVWNERGLFLATISMDYYDPNLLSPVSAFPRSEAFRIAMGVDAGSGPKRIELRVVPTSVATTSDNETKLSFGVQTCWYQAADSCTAVPGAIARYFGIALDQPRVILKAFVPWSQLGVAGPPQDAGLRLALSVTAFYRSRWMSNDGVAPDVAMSRPSQAWSRFRLGGPAAPDFPSDAASPLAAEPRE